MPKMSVGYARVFSMKKKDKKLGLANEARRKVESQALFYEMMKAPHLVATPEKYKGSRKENTSKAIKESKAND
jgi:hypothetical protein